MGSLRSRISKGNMDYIFLFYGNCMNKFVKNTRTSVQSTSTVVILTDLSTANFNCFMTVLTIRRDVLYMYEAYSLRFRTLSSQSFSPKRCVLTYIQLMTRCYNNLNKGKDHTRDYRYSITHWMIMRHCAFFMPILRHYSKNTLWLNMFSIYMWPRIL